MREREREKKRHTHTHTHKERESNPARFGFKNRTNLNSLGLVTTERQKMHAVSNLAGRLTLRMGINYCFTSNQMALHMATQHLMKLPISPEYYIPSRVIPPRHENALYTTIMTQ